MERNPGNVSKSREGKGMMGWRHAGIAWNFAGQTRRTRDSLRPRRATGHVGIEGELELGDRVSFTGDEAFLGLRARVEGASLADAVVGEAGQWGCIVSRGVAGKRDSKPRPFTRIARHVDGAGMLGD